MSLKKRFTAVLLLGGLLAAELFCGSRATVEHEKMGNRSAFFAKDTLYFWYTDEALTDFVNSAALEYYEKTGYRIVPKIQSGLEYLEAINEASLRSDEIPDLYVTTNDTLEKAYLAGLASEIDGQNSVRDTSVFCQTAQDAVTYHGRQAGYPFYYETSFFLYNKTYLLDAAKAAIQAEADAKAGEEATAILEDAGTEDTEAAVAAADAVEVPEYTDEELDAAAGERMKELLPDTIEDILTFSDHYDAPENVESIFKWDVSDIFYNYFFVGNYMMTGGNTGDDAEQVNLNNAQTAACMQMYQDLNQFFSIDAKEVSYDSILQEFKEGKIIYTIATTDAIGKLEAAKEAGEFPYEYGVAVLPDINSELQTRSLSVTSAVVVNGYSEKKEIANDFARFLTEEKADSLYERAGKVSAREGVPYENQNVENCMEEYRDSISMPKMIETSNFWVQLEIGFTRVWSGEDIQTVLDELDGQMREQLTGIQET
ncbi:MAG: extracellular solute-binding protein [Lachnospiraceae bacterium]|nr:extracellular solute-binding protein [Lachnospiraceae bacterium]